MTDRGDGDRVRHKLGSPHVERVQDLITRYAWGEIWTRPELDRHTRRCITLAVLATLHHDEELAMHARAALRNGLTREEVREVLLQVSVYAGVSAANRAIEVAQETLRQEDG
ncbi:carboxymuconolactone decarboxylase family protein [Plantactinospora sp. KLBMP9567]|uniref:carboxymuconolactone decarboxylase family protein n=1 Tax=Plantactinospora sp. KLBMP9567 TaxID=3085900 RepID=UPI002981AA23|nr:carboxymuconolactone decarboxylase family protein [Plantactinospora sp. KLBMP9567]MDW5329247.1 carboxymuconolactone decarboxylase family protein [Plantactinospora sp. KLBMP9567]